MLRKLVAATLTLMGRTEAFSVRTLMEVPARNMLVEVTCAAELSMCNADANCGPCFDTLQTSFPPPAVGTQDCAVFSSWFLGIILPTECPSYRDLTASAGPANNLTALSLCYYNDVVVNENALSCPLVIDPCEGEQNVCGADPFCAACISTQSTLPQPQPNWTCNDFSTWSYEALQALPETCVVDGIIQGQPLQSLASCRYESALASAGITNCFASTTAPSISPTFSPTSSPVLTQGPTLSPTMSPTFSSGPNSSSDILIQAEDFDAGLDVGYFISVPSDDRFSNDIRKEEQVTVATLVDGGYSVRRVTNGDWFRYTIDVNAAGAYSPIWTVAAYDVDATGTLDLELKIVLDNGLSTNPCEADAGSTLKVTGIDTGGWKTFETFIGDTFALDAGDNHFISICMVSVTNFEFDSVLLTYEPAS